MKKLVLASFLAAALCSVSALAEELKGYVSDSHCGAKHHEVSDANTKCVNGCLKNGTAVLVVGDKVLKMDAASTDKVKAFAGQNVTVMGDVSGDTVKVDSVAAAQ